MAKQGQMDAVKIMAKDLVRTRRYVKKFMLMRANIQAVSEDPNSQVSECDGSGHERRHQGHDEHEQTDEAARDPE